MAIGQDFYPDQGLRDFQNLSNLQSAQALGYGDQAAKYADPFMDERGKYQNQLSKLMQNPGSMKSSPFYKFAYNQGMNALQRKGSVRSGNKLAALMKYGQGLASQLYGQQAGILSNLAMSGSSPAAAGLAYARGTERSQDYAQMGQAARAAGNQGNAMMGAPQTPWWQQGSMPAAPLSSDPYRDAYYGSMGPSGETYTGSYQPAPMPSVGGPFSGGEGYGGFPETTPDYGGFDSGYAEQDYWGYE